MYAQVKLDRLHRNAKDCRKFLTIKKTNYIICSETRFEKGWRPSN